MEFIQHPSYIEQTHDIELILSKLTIENINKLLERLELNCVSFERLETSGRINIILNLKVQSQTCSYTELILKISNPHRYWRQHRTKNEVYSMKYLHEHTTIPLPKLIDYSDDSKTSILSCEYILMKKIHGNTLESVIEQMSDQALTATVIEMIGYVRQLRQIELLQMNQIGSFCSREMFLGGPIEDGPTLGPFNTLKEYIIQHLQWSIQRIQTDEELFQLGEHLIKSLQNIIDHAEKDPNLSNSEIKFHFTHTDLNSSNIIVNENTGKILAVLDWETCALTFNNNDIEFCSSWFESDQREAQITSLIQQEYLDLINDACDMQKIYPYLDVMYPAMYATCYSRTWFQCEQTVSEHIKQFLKETEDGIIVFNNNILEDNK